MSEIIKKKRGRKPKNTTKVENIILKSEENSEDEDIILHLPINPGSELSKHEEYLYSVNPNWYYKSKVNIITETNFNETEIHITEKTWKAIYLGVPFVISASNGHLKTLRDMGFKTFNSLINEDYDEMNGKAKIKKIIDSAEELSNIYNKQEVLDICRYNQELYSNLEHRRQIFKEVFLDKLPDIENIITPKTLI